LLIAEVVDAAFRGVPGCDLGSEAGFALESLPHIRASKLASVTYRYMCISGFWLRWRRMRPSRCSMSQGRQGASRWCRAMSRSWMLVPTPIFAVDPTRTLMRPSRQAANRLALAVSVVASWTKATRSAGTAGGQLRA
jgi:hypothetical protein